METPSLEILLADYARGDLEGERLMEAEAILTEYVDGEIPAESARVIDAILRGTPSLQAEVNEIRSAAAAIRELPPVPAPPTILEGVRKAIQQERPSGGGTVDRPAGERAPVTPFFTWSSFSSGVAAAAALLLCALLVFQLAPFVRERGTETARAPEPVGEKKARASELARRSLEKSEESGSPATDPNDQGESSAWNAFDSTAQTKSVTRIPAETQQPGDDGMGAWKAESPLGEPAPEGKPSGAAGDAEILALVAEVAEVPPSKPGDVEAGADADAPARLDPLAPAEGPILALATADPETLILRLNALYGDPISDDRLDDRLGVLEEALEKETKERETLRGLDRTRSRDAGRLQENRRKDDRTPGTIQLAYDIPADQVHLLLGEIAALDDVRILDDTGLLTFGRVAGRTAEAGERDERDGDFFEASKKDKAPAPANPEAGFSGEFLPETEEEGREAERPLDGFEKMNAPGGLEEPRAEQAGPKPDRAGKGGKYGGPLRIDLQGGDSIDGTVAGVTDDALLVRINGRTVRVVRGFVTGLREISRVRLHLVLEQSAPAEPAAKSTK